MNIEQVKDILESIGYPVQGDDFIAILDSLHDTYGPQVVGSSVRTLGDAEPLYVKAGQVAFMVDNEEDLKNACRRIRAILQKREADQPVRLESEKRSQRIKDIVRIIDLEVSAAENLKRDLSGVDDRYLVTGAYDLKLLRNHSLLVDDLLSHNKTLNQKAVQALQTLFIYQR